MERRMKNAAYFTKAFYWFAQAEKTLEEINMVQECEGESFGASGMTLPGPREDLSKID